MLGAILARQIGGDAHPHDRIRSGWRISGAQLIDELHAVDDHAPLRVLTVDIRNVFQVDEKLAVRRTRLAAIARYSSCGGVRG